MAAKRYASRPTWLVVSFTDTLLQIYWWACLERILKISRYLSKLSPGNVMPTSQFWTVLRGPHQEFRTVTLRLAVWRMARAISERSDGGSLPIFLFSSFPFFILVKFSQYLFHLSAICTASVKFSPAADLIHCRRGWNFRVIDLNCCSECRQHC